jgi:peptidyl-prolyl cis-trans isomerase B (cyclophilin B)
VGTPKRERQKENRRQSKIEELAEKKRRENRKRNLKWTGIIGGLAIVIIAAALISNRNTDKKISTAASTTTIDGATVTTIAGETTTTVTGATTIAVAPTTTIAGAATTAAPVAAAPPTVPAKTVADPTPCPKADGSEARVIEFKSAPPMCIDPTKKYSAVVTTNKGSYTATLDAVKAPKTVNNFVVLARYHYFDINTCHRIIPDFVVQCGDPTATGRGGPGYSFADELPKAGEYKVGSLAMANSGPNTNGSQFFLITGKAGAALDPKYSHFGQVDAGQDAIIKTLDAAGTPAGVPTKELIYIEKVEIKES